MFKTTLHKKITHVTFMPGSRKGEIARLMPIFKEVRSALNVERTTLIVPDYFTKEQIANIYGDLHGFEIVHEAHTTLYEADFAFICSGTATLEAALIGTPFILAYRAKKLDYMIGRRLIKLNYVGLANIMFEKFKGSAIHPEFLQDEVTTENLLESYKNYEATNFLQNSQELRAYLKHGSSKRVAEILTSTSKP
jgi:lipid-A-disaccharide synthase